MSFDLGIPNNECDIGKVFVFKHPQEIFRHLRLRYLDTDGEHPNIIETEFTIVSTKNVKLSFDDISSVSASWSWLKLTCGYFLPVIALNVKHMDVIHPVYTIVSSEVDDFWVDQAPSSWDTGAWLITAYSRFYPGKRFCIKIEYIIKLSKLIWLTTDNLYLFIKCNSRVL